MKPPRVLGRIKAPFLACALILAASSLLPGCAGEKRPLRIGINDWPPCAIWAIAEKEGFLKGTPIEVIHFENWSDSISSLYLGKLDFTHASYLNAIFYAGKGESAKIILSLDTIAGSDGLVLSNRLASPRDLVGARIAVEVDTDEHFLLYKALANFGVPSSSVKLVSTTSKDAARLFLAGEVEACFTYDPYLSEAAASGKGRMVWSTRDAPGYMVDVLVASDSVLKSRKADSARLTKAWFRSLEFIKAQPDKAFPVMAEALGMKLEDFRPFFEAFEFYSAEDNRRIFASGSFKSTLAEMTEFLVKEQAIPAALPLAELYTDRFVADGGK